MLPAMAAFKVMIVEDDASIRALVAEALSKWELEVLVPDPAGDLLGFFASERPHLILLDVGLPRLDGFEWCSRLRAVSRVPILFVSALAGPSAAVRALAEGGDDWLSKPFEVEVLVAKVRALLRRAYSWAPEPARHLERGGLVLDRDRGIATREGRSVALGRNEALLLGALLERDGRIATRDELSTALWSADAFVDDNTLTVNVTRLKKALGSIGAEDAVETVRGAGYRIP